ncbi:MAG: ribosomal protein L13e [Candidatus Thorarchaeota archaeon]
MSFDIRAEPFVKSPDGAKPRKGRGFTKEELKAVEITVSDARNMGLIVDTRRRTVHEENVEILKRYLKEMEELVEAILAEEKAAPKAPKAPEASDAIATLSSLKAVTKSEAETLVAAGIKTFEDLAYCEIQKVANKTGISDDRLTEMVTAALKKV